VTTGGLGRGAPDRTPSSLRRIGRLAPRIVVTNASSPAPGPELEALYAAEAARLVTWARARIRSEHRGLIAPEDIAQDTWLRAVEKFATFDAAATTFRAWILTVAKFVLAEATRRAFYQQRMKHEDGRSSIARLREEVPDLVTTITSRAARDEAMGRVFAWVDGLDDVDRQVFILHFLEELPHKDVAARLGLLPNTVSKRWERLRGRLRALAPLWSALQPTPADGGEP
jgi:RNA polymerase sigma-70 factor (ECF subfamily)